MLHALQTSIRWQFTSSEWSSYPSSWFVNLILGYDKISKCFHLFPVIIYWMMHQPIHSKSVNMLKIFMACDGKILKGQILKIKMSLTEFFNFRVALDCGFFSRRQRSGGILFVIHERIKFLLELNQNHHHVFSPD